jgi:uncharacterized repeat protein (TIGR03803 family)
MRGYYLGLIAVLVLSACSGAGSAGVTPIEAPASLAVRAAGETVLYNFQGGADGANPQGTLIADASGALYGTTTYGGVYGCAFNAGCGTVFKLTPEGSIYSHSVLYAFAGGSDGDGPGSGVVADSQGRLYGTTEYGGANSDGIVFRLTPSGSSYSETVLYSFAGGQDGNAPLAGLTIDSAGDLFGATLLGGGSGPKCITGSGCGTIFELKRSGATYAERILVRFHGGRDGATPGSPPLIVGKDLYGTTATGGGNPTCGSAPINTGCGTIYELRPSGSTYALHTLYRFAGAPHDAANAFAGLTLGKDGIFYGLGQYGGAENAGAIFALQISKRSISERRLCSLGKGTDGIYPVATLALGRSGVLYGSAEYSANSNDDGAVFELKPPRAEQVLFDFPGGTGGAYPVGGILVGSAALYGTATYGGSASAAAGIVFALPNP